MHDDETRLPIDVHAVIGNVVASLVGSESGFTLRDIISGLHCLKLRSGNIEIRKACLEAIHLLSEKMH